MSFRGKSLFCLLPFLHTSEKRKRGHSNANHNCVVVGAEVEKNVTVPVSSDKGLCGGINSTVTKFTKAIVKTCSGGLQLSSISCIQLFFGHLLNKGYSM